MENYEPLLIFLFAGVFLVFVVGLSIYTFRTCTVPVKAIVKGVPEMYGNMSGNVFLVEYVYNGIVYTRPTPLYMKDLRVDQIIYVKINPKNPKQLIHESANKPLMKILWVIVIAVMAGICMLLKQG